MCHIGAISKDSPVVVILTAEERLLVGIMVSVT